MAQRVGALQDEYLARGRPLGASRVLWEVGEDPVDVRTLRARLVGAMAIVERLLTAGLVEVAGEDPRSDAAQLCLDAYAAEMDATLATGFDPARSRAVEPEGWPRRRVLSELEAHARRAGAEVVHPDTNRALGAATSLYRSTGCVEVAPFNDEAYADHWFEKRLAHG